MYAVKGSFLLPLPSASEGADHTGTFFLCALSSQMKTLSSILKGHIKGKAFSNAADVKASARQLHSDRSLKLRFGQMKREACDIRGHLSLHHEIGLGINRHLQFLRKPSQLILANQKIPIQSVKISDEMCAIQARAAKGCKRPFQIFERLCEEKVSICFSDTVVDENERDIFCLVSTCHKEKIEQLVLNHGEKHITYRFICDLILMTLYPHRSDSRVALLLISTLLSRKIRVYRMASSISTLSFVVDLKDRNSIKELTVKLFDIQK